MVLRSFFFVPLLFLSCADVERDNPQDPNNVDGKVYSTTEISGLLWMGQNLNHDVSGSKCYNDTPSNCNIYGRLYSWSAAKNVCPGGWHLPSENEFRTLTKSFLSNQGSGGWYIGGQFGGGSGSNTNTYWWGAGEKNYGIMSRNNDMWYGGGTPGDHFYVRCVSDWKK